MKNYRKLYLEQERNNLKKRILYGCVLYPVFYAMAGVALYALKWYFGIPLLMLLVFIARIIEENVDELKKCQVEDGGVKHE